MIRYEATDGPYLRWLLDVERRLGPRVWRIIQGLDTLSADAILASRGVIPWAHCAEKARWDDACRKDGKTSAESRMVRLEPVEVADGWLSKVETADPGFVPDPRRLTRHGLSAG